MSKFTKLGRVIKSYRLAAEESIEDLSGAVEVEPDFINDLESGKAQPPEDILALIINHLNIEETEASELWTLAGYETEATRSEEMSDDDAKQLNVNVPSDKPILYTDRVHVVSNGYGVVLNFIQGVGPNGPAQVVSRVGMSHEHAKSVLEVLQKSLDKTDDQN